MTVDQSNDISKLDPAAAFHDLAPNFMTPHLVAHALVAGEGDLVFAVELSEGEGFDRTPIFGVTVATLCPVHSWEHLPGLGKLFYCEQDAMMAIGELGELVTYQPFEEGNTGPAQEVAV